MIRRGSVLLVFAKAPIAGRVKTRLIPVTGPGKAAALHAAMVLHTLRTAQRSGFDAIELWCQPLAQHTFFRLCQRRFGVGLKTQYGQNLGARIVHAVRDALKRHRRAVIIGTDCPELCVRDLKQAGQWLNGPYAAVLGPCEDGGYFLIGLRRPLPELFRNMAWGGSEVLKTTRLRLGRLGVLWAELPLRWDLDRPQDLSRWLNRRRLGLRPPV
ncbi:MAG: TIGR04282 family arsenosugar biosynthesis glycosyltransferase [Gammaproteobacteria bacterium]